jgi:hypothetical protein
MIKCNADGGCGDWYHYRCEDLTEELVARIQNYACKSCIASGLASTTFKAVDGEAAADGSANGPDYEEPSTAGGKREVTLQSALEPTMGTKTKMSPSSIHKTPSDDAALGPNNNDTVGPSGAANTNVIARADAETGPTIADIFKALRDRPQTQELRQIALQQPEAMKPILQRMIISQSDSAQLFQQMHRAAVYEPQTLVLRLQNLAVAHSRMAHLISQDPEQFLRLLTADVNDDGSVPQATASRTVNDKAVPEDPNLSAYERIANKLNVNTELLAGYNGTDQTGEAVTADYDLARAAAAIRPHMKTVIERQRGIYAQMGLMKVMGLDDADFALLRGDPGAVKKAMSAQIQRLAAVQNDEVMKLIVDLKRMTKNSAETRVSLDVWKLFSWDLSGLNKPQN